MLCVKIQSQTQSCECAGRKNSQVFIDGVLHQTGQDGIIQKTKPEFISMAFMVFHFVFKKIFLAELILWTMQYNCIQWYQ